jgi:hypothetical protein
MAMNKTVEVIIEKGDGELYARIEGIGAFTPVTVGETTQELFTNLRALIDDYLANEGKADKAWIKLAGCEFTAAYDLQAFFAEHSEINVSAIAKRAGINASLLRQYSSGIKHPSKDQAKKIEAAVHSFAKELLALSLHVD